MGKDMTFVVFRRSILNWEWYKDGNTARLFFHLILCANHEDNVVRGRLVKRGQHLTSYRQLASELGLTVKQIRVALEHLRKGNEVAHLRAGNAILITVEKYDFYQSEECLGGQTKGHPKGIERATNNNINNINTYSLAADGGEDEILKQAKEVVDYFNEKCGTKYRYSKTTLTPIKARLKDFTVEDCKKVIDTKVREWLGDDDMAKYLRPSTLFRESHFEEYLNQASKTEVKKKPTLSQEQLMSINWED